MQTNPKYTKFQWQIYTIYTWSIENVEVNNIPNTMESWMILPWVAVGFMIWFIWYILTSK